MVSKSIRGFVLTIAVVVLALFAIHNFPPRSKVVVENQKGGQVAVDHFIGKVLVVVPEHAAATVEYEGKEISVLAKDVTVGDSVECSRLFDKKTGDSISIVCGAREEKSGSKLP